jgi:hypothetical protein
MRPNPAALLLIGLIVTSSASAAFGQALDDLETRDLRLLYFGVTESYLAPYAGRCFENAIGFHRQLFSWTPSEKVTTLLFDFSDAGNAITNTVPRNRISVDIAPLSFAFETVVANERMNWLMNHELAHVATLDQAGPSDRLFRKLFLGKVSAVSDQPESALYFYLTSPRLAAPRWYHEGLAVFIETWMAGGLGRAQGAYDEMMFRSMVKDGSRFYDPLGLVSEGIKEHFQTETNSYLYGTRFMDYLAYRYSPEAVIRWGTRGDGTKAYYASQFASVFGLPLDEAWRDWIAFEHEFQQANLEMIRQYPVTRFTDLSPSGLGSVSRAFFDPDTRKIYAALNYPGVVGHIGAISVDNGSVEALHEVKEPTKYTVSSLAYDPQSKTIFYTADNFAYRDLVAFDVRTKRARTLLKDARIGELAFDRADGSLWGIRVFNGICTLVRIPRPYSEWNQMVTWPYGTVIYDLDISPDGRLLSASVGAVDGSQSLHVMQIASLRAGDPTPTKTFDFGTAIPLDFVFSPDGRYLYGSSYYTGVSNIFRYDLQTEKLEAISNTETGFFRPIPRDDGTLIVFRYTGQGFVPATIEVHPVEDVAPIKFLGEQIVEKHPVVKSWKVGSPADIPLDSLITYRGKYRSLRNLGLESLYPVVQGYKDSVGVGLRANFSDPAFFNHLYVTASYSPDDTLAAKERPHISAGFERYDWKAFIQWNRADFYDLFGPTQTSLKGYGAGLGWHRTLVFDQPRQLDLNADVAYYGGLDRLPDFQGIPVNFNSTLATRVKLSYQNLRQSLGAVDDEKGTAWDVAFAGDRAGGKSFPKLLGSFDQGYALPLKHSSIFLRGAAGISPSDPAEPFANFYFGGFRNNWVDHGDEKRYRSWYSFPGLDINEVGGRNFVKGMLEWNLPPVRFRSVGRPGFFLTRARPALFATVLSTNLDNSGLRHTVGDAGGQVDLRFTLVSILDMTLSAGYAIAFEEGRLPRDEFMLSLKILR